MNYVQILAKPLSALKTINESQFANLLASTRIEISSLCRMQSSEVDPETFRSRGNVIDRLSRTLRVLEAHELFPIVCSHYSSLHVAFYAMEVASETGPGKSVVAKALQNFLPSKTATA